MKWTFWTRTQPVILDDCGTIDPLLSLYADGMASAEEARRVETHLPDCPACRASLDWMQATQRALAARPIVSPPADLRARIASAIAASSAAPVPVSFTARPARAFALRPALAAAASITVLGLVSYGLLHQQQPQVTVHPMKPPVVVATVPRVNSSPSGIKPATGLGIKQHIAPHVRTTPQPVRSNPDLMARVQPDESQSTEVQVPAEAGSGTKATEMPAPVIALPKPHLSLVKKPSPPKFKPELMATNTHANGSHTPPAIKVGDNKPETVVATARPNPPAPVSVDVGPPSIKQDPSPTVVVASTNESHPQTADLLGPVRARLGAMRTFTHTTVSKAESGAFLASRTIEPGGTVYIDGIHSR